MRYDLGSYLVRKRVSLEEFAAKNNIKSVNDIGMFILNNKMFELSDELVQRLTELCMEKEPEAVEDMLIISPKVISMPEDRGAQSILEEIDQEIMAKLVIAAEATAAFTPAKETGSGRKGKKVPAADHSSSVANRS